MLFEADPYPWDLPAKMRRHVWSNISRCRSQLSPLQMNYKQRQGRYAIKCHKGSCNLPVKAIVTQVLVNRFFGVDWSKITLNDQCL